ncbi:MAG TPA: caspase family protein, partial [Syntrophorhabdaceae bacterium]|nr:caspase family protein [Syntrophorhabdaceae bacterium]
IDTGMHTAPISRIGVDRNERFIVTGSNDKTFSEIKNTVSSIAGKVAMFVDTCHSGGVMGKRAITDITGVINELTSAENGVVVFASSTGRQYSLEDPQWQNGAFTKAVIEGIAGKADLLGKGKITVNMLDAFIAERVKEITKGKQTPVTTKPNTVPDFPIAVR